ncbi:hypothetical protein CEUSTIGMA_g11876.t1 [Chlamydomonas eustigma]|uniref:Zinc finger Sec23/Sec24-type domain-containing protein n=1 Tax=Chlamydomonas eustigma TaxID=1157962 RepID=A0A250XN61_9CHLO|nr:hypothetical protein CEUSTIGMA_g11876.t1 [Chlamydomonas eustigma]|eukprot:GAX84456.1 hypothetical protein CEUSTIGMA_g11876.t1 [Chlamydomonas eustigma]
MFPPRPPYPLQGTPNMNGNSVQPPVDQFNRLSIGGVPQPSQAQGALPPGVMPPSGPMAPGGFPMRPPAGFPGPMGIPPGGPPSSGMPINLPSTGPPSVVSGGLAGIPGGMMRPPGAMPLPGPVSVRPPGGLGMPMPAGMPPPSNGIGMPPTPVSMSMQPGAPPRPGIPPPPFGAPPASIGGNMGMPLPLGGNMGMPPPPSSMGMPPPPGYTARPPGPPSTLTQGPAPPGHPGPPGAPRPLAQPAQQSQRIDPSSIPRPVIATSSGTMQFDTRVAGQPAIPPPAASRYFVRDRGNASPRYMRSTLGHMPFSSELGNSASMPLAVVVSPLALPHPRDDQIQVVDLGELGPVRCGRCKAYMNPYMRFMASGRSFTCNFCGHSNSTPDAYFCHLGHDGRRSDADERPELCKGSVEYVATPEYMIRPPMQNAHFFVIDASAAAAASGALATACSCVSRALDDIPAPERALVGLATFDSSTHFYSIRAGCSQPNMLVVSDTFDIYVPDSAPLLLELSKHKEALQALLAQIPTTIFNGGPRPSDSCGGAAIEAAICALKPTGGRVHAFLGCLPSSGAHGLKLRDAAGVGEKDKLLYLQSQDNTLKSLAGAAADFQVSVDISLLGQGYMDVASLSDLTTATGGTLYQYTPFNPALDHDQVLNDLKWNLVRPQGLEAVMRVRCSQGFEVDSYLGAFYRQPTNPTDVYLPAIDSDKSILATVKVTEKLTAGAECYFQAAILYTTLQGQRRIRVHTMALQVTNEIGSMFKYADLDTQITVMARRLAASLPGSTLAAARDSTTANTVATLAAYRKHCAINSPSVQLILPEALKLLPLYALALLKGPVLREGVKPDDRSLWMSQMMSLTPARISPLMYPRLLPLRKTLEGLEAMEELPDGVVLTAESLELGGVYLLENGNDALLHLDRNVQSDLVQALLGVSSYEELLKVPQQIVLLPREDAASKALQDVLVKVRMHRSSFLRLRVTRKGDPLEASFLTQLVEDRSVAGMSYVEYLCQLHRLIQMKLT